MFTGIVQGCVEVVELERKTGLIRFAVELPEARSGGLERGASIAIDGVCLTVSEHQGRRVFFDAMGETLAKTTLDSLTLGRRVNIERSARFGDEIGGHIMSGHVFQTARIVEVMASENNHVLRFQLEPRLMDFILAKGFLGIDGCSLTIVDVEPAAGHFTVAFIPETLERTTFGFKGVGEQVNIELDARTQAIVETVRAFMARQS